MGIARNVACSDAAAAPEDTAVHATAKADPFSDIRASEFSRLGDEVYVDHAGATLPSERQLRDVFQVRGNLQPWRRALFHMDGHAEKPTRQA